MECDRILELVPLYVGGDCTPAETGLVDLHVASCQRCAAELAGFRASMSALKSGAEMDLPAGADLWQDVRRGLVAEKRIVARPSFGAGFVRFAAAAAVFVIGLGGAIWAMKAFHAQPPSKGEVAKTVAPAQASRATAQVPVPVRVQEASGFDLRSLATPVSTRTSALDVIPEGSDPRSYRLDELRVIKPNEVTVGY